MWAVTRFVAKGRGKFPRRWGRQSFSSISAERRLAYRDYARWEKVRCGSPTWSAEQRTVRADRPPARKTTSYDPKERATPLVPPHSGGCPAVEKRDRNSALGPQITWRCSRRLEQFPLENLVHVNELVIPGSNLRIHGSDRTDTKARAFAARELAHFRDVKDEKLTARYARLVRYLDGCPD